MRKGELCREYGRTLHLIIQEKEFLGNDNGIILSAWKQESFNINIYSNIIPVKLPLSLATTS